MNNIDAIILKNLSSYKILAEDEELRFSIVINQITDEIKKKYQIYEVDHTQKVIYLEAVNNDNFILIASNDDLQLPLAVVKNYNEAANFMGVNSTHIYRAARREGKPDILEYNNFLLIKI